MRIENVSSEYAPALYWAYDKKRNLSAYGETFTRAINQLLIKIVQTR